MQSNQPRIEEVASDNIVERQLEPPKTPKRKKKVSFAVWWELYATEEQKKSAENIEQQNASSVTEIESLAEAQDSVDQKGDRPTPESESKEMNKKPFKTWSKEHVPVNRKICAGNIAKQNNSLVREEECTAGVQETIDISEKKQPSKSKEQPPMMRGKKKKMIPFHIWLEKHAPADPKISAESTEMEEVSPESISVLMETPEKEQPFKSGTENIKKQDTYLLEDEGDQEDSMKKICKEEPVISTTQLVTEKTNISTSQKKVEQKVDKQLSKTKRVKKTPLLWKSFPESNACVDLAFFMENSDINNGLLPENQSNQAALPSSGKRTFWKTLPKSEPHIDVSFCAENIESQSVSMPAHKLDEGASLKKESKPKNNIEIQKLTEVPENPTAKTVQGLCLSESQNLPHSTEKATSQAECTCIAKSEKSEKEYMEVQKYLMQQLDEMFSINQKLNAKLKEQKDLMRKQLSESRQSKKSMVSVQIQTDSQDKPKQKTVRYSSASTQTEMEVEETRCQVKPVRRTVSTQTELDVLETRSESKPVYQTISTQTELFLLLRKQPSETQLNGHRDQQVKLLKQSTSWYRRKSFIKAACEPETLSDENVSGANSEQQDISEPEIVVDQAAAENHTNETVIDKPQEAIAEETVTETRQNGDHQAKNKLSKKSKRQNKKKSANKTVSEKLENLNNDHVSRENSELQVVSIPETFGVQTASIKNKNDTNESISDKLQQITEKATVSTTQQNGDQPHEKKPPKKSKRKIRKKTAMKAEIVGDQEASVKNKICTKETVISKVHKITEGETISEAQENGDHQDDKKPSKKSKRKIRKKSAIKATSEVENLNNNTISGGNPEQVVSMLGTVGDQTASNKNKIHAKATVITKLQQITEKATVSTTQQNGDQPHEKKPSRKSKRKIRKKAGMKEICTKETVISKVQQIIEEETISEARENGDHQDEKGPLTKPNCKKNRKMAMKTELETVVKISEAATSEVSVDSTEEESGLMETQTTSPSQIEVTAEESDDQNNVSEQEEVPMKKMSLWKRIKKALTPTCLQVQKEI